jgi:hypothetical protein
MGRHAFELVRRLKGEAGLMTTFPANRTSFHTYFFFLPDSKSGWSTSIIFTIPSSVTFCPGIDIDGIIFTTFPAFVILNLNVTGST